MRAYRVELTAGHNWNRKTYECYVGAMTVDSACVKTRKWARKDARKGEGLLKPEITLVQEISANIVG